MAVNIDEFKRDLEQLKNQRSVIQAKLDEANRHITELMETLKGMGFNTVDDAKQAYVRQLNEAESQHELVKRLIQEIKNVDASVPSREDVMEKLNALSEGNPNVSQVQAQHVQETLHEKPVVPELIQQPVVSVDIAPGDDMFIQQNIVPPAAEPINTQGTQDGSVNLSDMLFASL